MIRDRILTRISLCRTVALYSCSCYQRLSITSCDIVSHSFLIISRSSFFSFSSRSIFSRSSFSFSLPIFWSTTEYEFLRTGKRVYYPRVEWVVLLFVFPLFQTRQAESYELRGLYIYHFFPLEILPAQYALFRTASLVFFHCV